MDLFREPSYLLWALAALILTQTLRLWSESRRRRVLEAFAHRDLLGRLYPSRADASRRLRFTLRACAL